MRFVKEYARYRIREMREHAKESPDYAMYWEGKAKYIKAYVEYWEKGLITLNEVMELISKA